jgi:hypothetical protein
MNFDKYIGPAWNVLTGAVWSAEYGGSVPAKNSSPNSDTCTICGIELLQAQTYSLSENISDLPLAWSFLLS